MLFFDFLLGLGLGKGLLSTVYCDYGFVDGLDSILSGFCDTFLVCCRGILPLDNYCRSALSFWSLCFFALSGFSGFGLRSFLGFIGLFVLDILNERCGGDFVAFDIVWFGTVHARLGDWLCQALEKVDKFLVLVNGTLSTIMPCTTGRYFIVRSKF